MGMEGGGGGSIHGRGRMSERLCSRRGGGGEGWSIMKDKIASMEHIKTTLQLEIML